MFLHELFLIRPDLRHEETIIQAANCFEYLTNVMNQVFDKVDARIEENNGRIRSFLERTNHLKTKIDSLIGINKAITIFSPVRFPVSSSSIADSTDKIVVPFTAEVKFGMNQIIECKFETVPHRTINDKSQFYHVEQSNKTYSFIGSGNPSSQIGYGPFPYYTESINNLLLFNEVRNMYSKERTQTDNMKRRKNTANEMNSNDVNDGNRIDPMPLPVLNRKMNAKKISEHLFYTPSVLNAPELDLPQYLPDLPGIANDIEFNASGGDDLFGRSQSAMIDVYSLPPISPEPNPIEKNQIIEQHSSEKITLPPLPLETVNEPKIASSMPAPVMAPPPPPPPPAIPAAPPAPKDDRNEPTVARNALLESIRGGAKLRKVDRSVKKVEKIEEDNPHSSLMASIRKAGGAGKANLRATALGSDEQVFITFIIDVILQFHFSFYIRTAVIYFFMLGYEYFVTR